MDARPLQGKLELAYKLIQSRVGEKDLDIVAGNVQIHHIFHSFA